MTWNRADTSIVKGYNVFRRDTDSAFVQTPINGAILVKDTLFQDSTVHQDRAYEYKVVAVDKRDDAGLMSDGSTVTATSVFHFINIFTGNGSDRGKFQGILDFRVLKNGRVVVVDDTGFVKIFSNDGNLLRKFSNLGFFPTCIAVDDSGNIFLGNTTDVDEKIIKADSMGILATGCTMNVYMKRLECVYDQLYAVDVGNAIQVVDIDLDALTKSWLSIPNGYFIYFAVDSLSRQSINNGNAKKNMTVDTSRIILSKWSPSGVGSFVAIGPKANIYVVSDPKILVFKLAGDLIARMETGNIFTSPYSSPQAAFPEKISFDKDGNMLVADSDYIKRYSVGIR
ncbi:MAG TPA: hypothetical protein VLX68_03350 [Chitinivibrionales bacterium]|nr:hypothetical protein [Chitinivibrionales bacterium]